MRTLTDVTDALSGARRREAAEFAALVERGRVPAGSGLAPLVGLALALTPAEHPPEPGFRAGLRAQLVAEAAARVPALPAQRTPEPVRPTGSRWRQAVAAVAVASAVTGLGAVAASSQALSGDALYGLKLRIESLQLSLADSDLERGRELLEQAETRLAEAERLAASGTADEPSTRRELARTLTRMDQAAAAGAVALLRSYQDTGDQEPMQLLDRFRARQQVRLQDLQVLLDPGMRVRFLSTVDALAVGETPAGSVLAISGAVGSRAAAGLPGHARVDDSAVGAGTTDTVTSAGSDAGAPSLSEARPELTVTAPSVSTEPLPSVTPDPVPTPTVVTSTSVAPLPEPTTTCVAIPPLSSC